MTRNVIAYAAAFSLVLLGACSKPASEATASDAAAIDAAGTTAADATTAEVDAAANGAMAPGGAMSPPAANAAVDVNAQTDPALAAASNSFTESQARGHIENAGYSDVTNLTKTADGIWTARAKKAGKTMDVALDFKGSVTAK